MDGYSDLRRFGQNEDIGQAGQPLGQERQDRCLQVDETDRTLIGRVPIEDAWGVGRRLSVRLRRIGLQDAWAFAPGSLLRNPGNRRGDPRANPTGIVGHCLFGNGRGSPTAEEYLLFPLFRKTGHRS